MQMTDQELKDLVASLAKNWEKLSADIALAQAKTEEQAAKTQAQIAKTEAQLAKSDAKLEKLGLLYGGVSDNMGAAAEEFFFNSLCATPTIGAIRYDEVHAKVYGGKMGQQTEYDIVLVNGTAAAIIEVKYKVHPSTINQVEKHLASYRQHFPEHHSFTLYGGIAGMSIPDEVVESAHQKGLFVLKCKGELLEADTQNMRAF